MLFARVRSVVWHPSQGLWNRRLIGALRRVLRSSWLVRTATTLVIHLDTALLWTRVGARRGRRLGPASVFHLPALPAGIPVLYLDLGTHTDAQELLFAARAVLPRWCRAFTAVGFEAHPDSCARARAAIGTAAHVRMVHAAACHDVPDDGHVRLYAAAGATEGKRGRSDSLHRPGPTSIRVPAVRLSDWLRAEGAAGGTHIILLRMNIEGAELDVLRDLDDHGLPGHIDGYYGLWDDAGKIDAAADTALRALTARLRIAPVTFNGRDMRWAARRAAIAYDLRTALHAGARRVTRRAA